MEYISTKEASLLWKISSRRIVKLCDEGRIPFAKMIGKNWLIPSNAVKPSDKRFLQTETQIKYNFPLFAYSNYSEKEAEVILKPLEFELYTVQKRFISGNFENIETDLLKILHETENLHIKIGIFHFLCFYAIQKCNPKNFIEYVNQMKKMASKVTNHKKEAELMTYKWTSMADGNTVYLTDFKISSEYNYDFQAVSYLQQVNCIAEVLINYDKGTKPQPEGFVVSAMNLENNNFFCNAIFLHG